MWLALVNGTLANMEQAEAWYVLARWSFAFSCCWELYSYPGNKFRLASWRIRGHMKIPTPVWGLRHVSKARVSDLDNTAPDNKNIPAHYGIIRLFIDLGH